MKSSLIKPAINSFKVNKSKSRQKSTENNNKKENEYSTKETNFTNTLKEYLNDLNPLHIISEPSRKYKRMDSFNHCYTNHNSQRKNTILKEKNVLNSTNKSKLAQRLSYYLDSLLNHPKTCKANIKINLNNINNMHYVTCDGDGKNKYINLHTTKNTTYDNVYSIKDKKGLYLKEINSKQKIIDELRKEISKTKNKIKQIQKEDNVHLICKKERLNTANADNKSEKSYKIDKLNKSDKENTVNKIMKKERKYSGEKEKYIGKYARLCENLNTNVFWTNFNEKNDNVKTEAGKIFNSSVFNLKNLTHKHKTNSCDSKNKSKFSKFNKGALSLNIDNINNSHKICQNSSTSLTTNHLLNLKNDNNRYNFHHHKSNLLISDDYDNNFYILNSKSRSLSKDKNNSKRSQIQFTNYNLNKINGKNLFRKNMQKNGQLNTMSKSNINFYKNYQTTNENLSNKNYYNKNIKNSYKPNPTYDNISDNNYNIINYNNNNYAIYNNTTNNKIHYTYHKNNEKSNYNNKNNINNNTLNKNNYQNHQRSSSLISESQKKSFEICQFKEFKDNKNLIIDRERDRTVRFHNNSNVSIKLDSKILGQHSSISERSTTNSIHINAKIHLDFAGLKQRMQNLLNAYLDLIYMKELVINKNTSIIVNSGEYDRIDKLEKIDKIDKNLEYRPKYTEMSKAEFCTSDSDFIRDKIKNKKLGIENIRKEEHIRILDD